MKIVLAQSNMWVGDVDRNTSTILAEAHKAKEKFAAELVVFPELALVGYPPEDLLFRPALYQKLDRAIEHLKSFLEVPVIIGVPAIDKDTGQVRNRALLIENGELRCFYDKQCLPNYSVFDEKRYFEPGNRVQVFSFKSYRIGLLICEDIWFPEPAKAIATAGADFIISINASPYHSKQAEERIAQLHKRHQESKLPILYVNTVGGQDELVFDGRSMCIDANGTLTQVGPSFEESLIPISIEESVIKPVLDSNYGLSKEAEIYSALVAGVRDYVYKNNFSGAILGLSGGIDSALTLAIAVDALGADAVDAVMMPFDYTSVASLEDAEDEAHRLGVSYHSIPIKAIYQATIDALQPIWGEVKPDTTEQNIQARSRGMLLMAMSNKSGKIVLTTGNKSELAVGYATLYGDMAGGFDVLKDIPKMLVYQLANYRNSISEVIPTRVIERAPSAELAPDQVDEDNLPPYPILDNILEMYIEQDFSVEDICAFGFDEPVVRRVAHLVDINEHKRRQAPPGIRISKRAFGKDRRYPITSGFRHQFGK